MRFVLPWFAVLLCPFSTAEGERVLPRARQVRIHYDAGWGNSISIRGSAAPLSWTSGTPALWGSGNVWTWDIPAGIGAFEFKPLLNDKLWSVGKDYRVAEKGSLDVYPFFGPSRGSLVTSTLPNGRKAIVYLPPSYAENLYKKYPVVYMHDGQNLFQASTAFGGVEWGVDETMDKLIAQGEVGEAIVVGIYNTSNRISEYTPMPDPSYGGGGADAYLDFLQKTVQPFIQGKYRVRTGPKSTFMMGSSLGGLVSFYAGWTRSSVYGGVAALSGSFWWNGEALTKTVQKYAGAKKPCRFYLDAGGLEPLVEETNRMRDALEALGYKHGVDLMHWFDPQGEHNEASWASRLHRPLRFLLADVP